MANANHYLDHGVTNGHHIVPTTVPSVNLSIEALAESKIHEILLDGTEIYSKPLTMSEHLCKLANKIDFLAEEEGRNDDKEEDEENVEFEKTKQPFQPPQWPWEGIRNHIRQSLTEVNVLIDVMSIAHKKNKKVNQPGTIQPPANDNNTQYMAFDYGQKELQSSKPFIQVCTKRKGLKDAAEILLEGERRLRKAKSDASTELDYHMQLLQLRKNWRIKRLGTKIMGDLSFKSAGSDFWHSGNFEVIKKSDENNDAKTPKPFDPLKSAKLLSPINVVIGSDLKGLAMLTICCESTKNPMKSFPIVRLWNRNAQAPKFGSSNQQWHKDLLNAHDVLFCKELFNRLAKEAVQMKTSTTVTPFVVVGNKISASIFPHTNLVLRLEHKLPDEPIPQTSGAYKSVFALDYAAMVLLQNFHKHQLNLPLPIPTPAVLGIPEKFRKAAVNAKPLNVLISDHEQQTNVVMLLEKIVRVAKHYKLRQLLNNVINFCENTLVDPYLQAHWSTVGRSEQNEVTVTVLCFGFDNIYRTIVKFFIGVDSIKALMKDGIVNLRTDAKSIQDFLLNVMCIHVLHVSQKLLELLGWTVLQFSERSGVNAEMLELSGSVIASSPNGEISIALKVGLTSEKQVTYQLDVQYPRQYGRKKTGMFGQNLSNQGASDPEAVSNEKWFLVGGKWQKVKIDELHGSHFMQKLETLLICLNDYEF